MEATEKRQDRPTLFGQPGWEMTLQSGIAPMEANVFLLEEPYEALLEGHPCVDKHGRLSGITGEYFLISEDSQSKEVYRIIYDEVSQKLEAEMKLGGTDVTVDREKYLFRVKEWLFHVDEQGKDTREEREVVLRLLVIAKFP